MTKKIFAMFLAVLMVVSMLPTSVFAAEACPGKGSNNHTKTNCDYTEVRVVEPGCGTIGYTVNKCNTCGDEFHTDEVKPTEEHTLVPMDAQPAYCGTPGFEAGQKCANCPAKFPGKPIDPIVGVGYSCELTEWSPANVDCTTGGTKTRECKHCDFVETKTITLEETKGVHQWGEPKVTKEATATAPGEAVVTCKECAKERVIKVWFAHEHVLYTVEGIAQTCTTDGLTEHQVCRICEAKFNMTGKALSDAEAAALIQKAGHKFADGAVTCVTTVARCIGTCGKDIDVRGMVKHEYGDWNWDQNREATCTQTGVKSRVCKYCRIDRESDVIDAYGHNEVVVTIPATCGSYAYSFTYCTRQDCDEKYNVNLGEQASYADLMKIDSISPITALNTTAFAANEERVLGGFYLSLQQGNTKTELYFNGKMDGSFLGLSDDIRDAVQVYLERVHYSLDNQYYLFFNNAEGVKTYIDLEAYEKTSKSGSKYAAAAVKLTTETPKAIFTWDDTYEVLVSKEMVYNAAGAKDSFFLGTYNNYETISASNVSYLGGNGQYMAKLCVAGEKVTPAHIIDAKVDVTAGYDKTAHVYNREQIVVEATCTTDGTKNISCQYCSANYDKTISAAHNWVNATANDLAIAEIKEDVYKAPTCVDGYRYMKCDKCSTSTKIVLDKVVLKGYGHLMTETYTANPTCKNPVDYNKTMCSVAGCDHEVKGDKKTWDNAGKLYATFEEASADHIGTLGGKYTPSDLAGDCTTAGEDRYVCSDCQKVVRVVKPNTGKHVMPEGTVYNAPSCTEPGSHATYICVNCKETVGDHPLGSAELTKIPALGHDLVVNPNYKKADCDKPVFDEDGNSVNYTHTCSRCEYKAYDSKLINKVTKAEGECEGTVSVYYQCHCGEEHMLGYKVLKHNFIRLPDVAAGKDVPADKVTYQAPTCSVKGFYTVECEYCGITEKKDIDTVDHTNAAGEKFNTKCTTASVTDRHCVDCCKHQSEGAAHKNCTLTHKDKDGVTVYDCEGMCWFSAVCHEVTTLHPSTCLSDGYTKKVCVDCGKETVEFFNGKWNGHMPAAAKHVKADCTESLCEDLTHYERFGNYHYEVYTYNYVTVENDALVEKSMTYVAQFEKVDGKPGYVHPDYDVEGYVKAFCQRCKAVHEWNLAKKTGLGFELNISNDVVTYGTLVEIVVSANGNNAAVHGFDFTVAVPAGAQFVGYEKLNDNFNLVVSAPEKADNEAKLSAFAVNNAEGKKQNVSIDGETALVKLFFRVTKEVVNAENGFVASVVKKDTAVSVLKDGVSTPIANFENFNDDECNTQMFLDFNGDNFATSRDLHDAMSMITREAANGKIYDAIVDVNKDGVIDYEDLYIAYRHLVGDYELEELLVMGISAEELMLLDLNEKVLCNNPNCQYELDADWNRCPICGNIQ